MRERDCALSRLWAVTCSAQRSSSRIERTRAALVQGGRSHDAGGMPWRHPALLVVLTLACGGEPSVEGAPPVSSSRPPASAPALAIEAEPSRSAVAAAPEPTTAPRPDDVLQTSRARVAVGTLEEVDRGPRYGGEICLVPTAAQPPTIWIELAPGTQVDRIEVGTAAVTGTPARTFDVVADGDPLGTGQVGTPFVVGRAAEHLELRPAARGGTVCLTYFGVIGTPAPGAALAERRGPPIATLPLFEPDDARFTLTGRASLSPATGDRAPLAALAFAHGEKTITYELALVRGRGDTSGAALVPDASSDPGALPGVVPWVDPPAAIDPRYREVCAGQRRRLVISRRASGPGVTRAAGRPIDRTIAHACGMESVLMRASDLDGDARLEIHLQARGRDLDRALEREWIFDAESFWTELTIDRLERNVVTRAPDGTSYELGRRADALDDRGQRTGITHVRAVATYERETDSFIVGQDRTDTQRAPRPWDRRDASEHPLLHAIRAALDAAVARAARAYGCAGYDDAVRRIEALHTIRGAADVAALRRIETDVAREMTHQCDCCGDCAATAAGNVACVAELALAPRDDAPWSQRLAECASALEGVTAECPSVRPADAVWLWPLVVQSARQAAAR